MAKAMRVKLLTAVALALLVIPSGASADSRSQTQSYVAFDVPSANCNFPSSSNNWGSACFTIQGDEQTVSISIDDDLGSDVAPVFEYSFRSATDSELAWGDLCGGVDNLAVPSGASRLVIFVPGPVWTPILFLGNRVNHGGVTCDNPAIFGTRGTVTVTSEFGA